MRGLLGGLCVGALIAAVLAAPASAGTFTPITGVAPSGIYRAADGTVWVLNEFQSSINQLSADGTKLKTLHVPSNSELNALTAGPDGLIYVTSALGMFRFDPATADGT